MEAISKRVPGASRVVQWLRIHLATQGTRPWSLVRGDPTCRGATMPVCHNFWAWAPRTVASKQQRRHRNKSMYCNEEEPALATRGSLRAATTTYHSQKIKSVFQMGGLRRGVYHGLTKAVAGAIWGLGIKLQLSCSPPLNFIPDMTPEKKEDQRKPDGNRVNGKIQYWQCFRELWP